LDKDSYKILGVDPGTNLLGYGIIEIVQKKYKLTCAGVVQLDHKKSQSEKLSHIFQRICVLIKQYEPKHFAIEAPFFGVNVQSMLKLGRAQGAAMAAASSCNIPVVEYSPKKIKLSITGNGNASKEQVSAMLKQILNIKQNPSFYDTTDAIGVALCHHFNSGTKSMGKTNYSGWKAFIKDNPKKLIKK